MYSNFKNKDSMIEVEKISKECEKLQDPSEKIYTLDLTLKIDCGTL